MTNPRLRIPLTPALSPGNGGEGGSPILPVREKEYSLAPLAGRGLG